ncbi:MAG: hypothetical protein ACM3PV_00175 [Betaproteobacteria bacterium]
MLEHLRAPRARAWLREAGALALAAGAITAVAFLTPPSVLEGQDWLQMHQPYRAYAARALAAGHLPLWNPYVGLGRPFLADLETAVFYPPNLLFLLLDSSSALALVLAAHVALALFGSLRFARSLGATRAASVTAALAFMLGAPVAACLSSGQIGYSEGACYVPLLFLLGARLQDRPSWQRAGGLAVLLALQLLCGHPQVAWITWLGLGAFLLGRGVLRPARSLLASLLGLGVALALAFALAAPALLPFLELAGQGNRSEPTLRFASGASMEWWQWASLFVPDGGRHAFYWTFDLYLGALAVVAGLAGLTRVREDGVRGLAFAGLLGALVAAGPRTPAFALLYHVVPGLGSFHIHSRAALLPCLSLAFAGAVFLSRPRGWRASRAALIAATLGGGFGFAWATAGLPPAPDRPALVQGALFLAAAALTAAAVCARPALSRLATAALPLVVASDLLTAHYAARVAWAPPAPSFLESERALARALARAGLVPAVAPPRVLVPPYVARENAAMAYGWSSLTGYGSLTLGRTWRYFHDRLAIPVPVDENTYVSAAVYERGPFAYAEAALAVGWDPRWNAVAIRRDADPRAYLATAVRRVHDWTEAARLMAGGHDVHAAALVEENGLLPPGLSAALPVAKGRAEITAFAPERVAIRAEPDRPALLVVKEAWYPGWTATVDGRPAPCVPANGWMRAVPLGPGAHEVVLRYRSRRLVAGVLLFAVTALLLVAAIARERGRRLRAAGGEQ